MNSGWENGVEKRTIEKCEGEKWKAQGKWSNFKAFEKCQELNFPFLHNKHLTSPLSLLDLILNDFFKGVVLSQAIPTRRNRDKIQRRVTTTTTTRAPNEDDETSEDCPEPFGFFADADQCDKYHACQDGRIEGERVRVDDLEIMCLT